MAKNNTQKQWVISRLKETGSITRNEALRNYISRLAAIIHDLKDEGWEIETRKVKTPNGVDFEYSVGKRPTKPVSTVEVVNGVAVETFKEVEV